MTTQIRMRPVLTRPLRSFVQALQRLFTPGDVAAQFMVFVLLLMPVMALETAGWPLALGTVLPVLLLSIFFGYLLARSHYNELLALIMSSVYGAAFVLLFAAINEPGSFLTGINSVFERSTTWLIDAVSGGINQDELVFTMLVATLLWFLGYSAAWHVFRIDRIWRALLPPALILVTNSIYYTGPQNLDIYLIIFMFMSLLLVVRSNLDAREWDWYVHGMRVPRQLRQQFFRVGALFALLTLLVAWVIPASDLQERLNRFQEFLAEEPLTELTEFWNRLFATGDVQGPSTADYYGGDSLQLGGAIQLGEQTVLLVSTSPERRYYWRSRVFDTYEGGRWLPAADTRLTDPQAPLDVLNEPQLARVPVEQTFTFGLRASRLIYAASQVQQVDLPTRTDLRYIGTDDRFINPETGDQAVKAMNISVIRPANVLKRGEAYTVTSAMSTATASQLRAASVDYPQWVRDLYLYVSPSITPRTQDLARAIVRESGAVTAYDQAKAIETWLRQNITYNERIPQPPRSQDPVDWFLFDLQQGYCNYYASSMIMMLRVLGIPSRMAAGFAQGTWDAAERHFVVEERDAHTWVEVYFPGYGWIEFEPTAAQAPLNRVDDFPVAQMPSPTPMPVQATPTATPSPTPTATQNPTQASQAAAPQNEPPTSTPTLTLTPTLTATPVILPTQPPSFEPPPPEDPSLLSFLLPLLGMVFVALLVVLLLVLALTVIWWWWEWRGLRGVSPVTRVYTRLGRYIALIGLQLSPDQTPAERRVRIVRELPTVDGPVTAITEMYTQERYGPSQQHPVEMAQRAAQADDAWIETRGNIVRRWLRRILMPWRR